ncbi:MAG: ABC transporter permease [Limnochordaceae bacterium]|uniref:ABC transporter permease n=1 Tax=Carboxydichorda subterranea TaxID=3109565 RepID=A0ABZ1BUN7_9FIRM|nr:ABC transporter permease [Limnochorda sp. L945t]MBE3598464.1 ABC transporter permease [Limnochordaceae bacterium]WRP16246.1 ABC transporter permease [Limnochorda sp. L945t]
MGRFLVNRLIQAIVTIFVYMTVTFLILQAMPGNITVLYTNNPRITAEVRQELERRLGLDQPWYMQYASYLKNFLSGSLGISFSQYPRPVWDIIAERAPRTVVLFFTATVVSFYIGFLLGRIIAWRRGATVDYAATTVGVTFWTAFYPLLGLIVMWLFAYQMKLFPLNQFISPSVWRTASVSSNQVFGLMLVNLALFALLLMVGYGLGIPRIGTVGGRALTQVGLWGGGLLASGAWWVQSGLARYALDIASHMVLPVFTLSLISFGGTMLLMRDSMLETIREDYVMAARARGLPDRVVRDRYAARTALLPVVTSFTLSIGGVVSGGIITETVFSWPGLGLTLLESARVYDYPLAVGAFVFTGVFVVLAHIVADLLHAFLDPRLRVAGGEITAAE